MGEINTSNVSSADTPSIGYTKLYPKTDKKWYSKDDAGTETEIGAGATPGNHASTHVNGTDDIQNASSSQKGLATAEQIAKLDGIETGADVTDASNVYSAGALMKSIANAKGDLFVGTANDTIARRAIGTIDGQMLVVDSSESDGVRWKTIKYIEPSDYFKIFDDFIGVDLNWYIWTSDNYGTNSEVSAISGEHGQIRIRSGETSGDYATLTDALKNFKASYNITLKTGFKLDHTVDHMAYIGFYDDSNNKIEFVADTAAGYWVCRNSSGGVSTSYTSSKALDTAWHHFGIQISASSIKFFIDEDQIVEHTTNIPTSSMYFRAQIARSAGTAVRDCKIDYVDIIGGRSY